MSYLMPGLIVLLVLFALIRKVDIYDAFVTGAKNALPLLARVLPYMAAMLLAMGVFRASGALGAITALIAPALGAIGMPAELVPLFTLRPFSGGAALALLNDVFDAHGVDTFLGFAASLMLGSTETIFYTIALYFGSVNVKKTRAAVPVALFSGAVGAAVAIAFARLMLS